MKIGIFTENYYPHPGGIPEHVSSTAKNFRLAGHEVTILTNRVGNPPAEKGVVRLGTGVPVTINGGLGRFTWAWNLKSRIRRILEKEKFDILHVHNPLTAPMPIWAISQARCPVAATYHAQHESSLAYALLKPWLRKIHSRIDCHIAVSAAAEKSISRYFPGSYHIVPNGVDTKRFRSFRNDADRKDFTVLFLGRLEHRKGLPVLLEAMKMLVREKSNIHLLVAGDGSAAGKYRADIGPELSGHVEFLGRLPNEAIAGVYNDCDVYCSPALGNESFGIVLLEAMACGRPVVASDIPGYRSVVRDGENGLLFKTGDPGALAKSLNAIADDNALRRKLVEAGSRTADEHDWTRVSSRLLELFEQLVSSRKTV